MASPGTEAADSSLHSAQRARRWRIISVLRSTGEWEVFELPEAFDSWGTLIWCGFDEDIASTVIVPEWERQAALFPERERTLIDEAIQHMENKSRDADPMTDEEWRADLKSLGLSAKAIDVIMHPVFEDLREEGTPLVWAKDTVKEAYYYLNYLLKKEERQLREGTATS